MRSVLSFILVMISALNTWAAGAVHYGIHDDFLSPRTMGMGNAFVAVSDDYAAIFFNPAGLAFMETGQINMGFGVAVDSNYQSLIKDMQNTSGSNGSTQAMIDLIERQYGKDYGLRAPDLSAFWARKNWGLAIRLLDLTTDMSFHQQIGPSLSLLAYQDTVIATSVARKVNWLGENHEVAWGVTPKLVYRGYFNKVVAAADLALDSNVMKPEDANEGLTLDADMGLMWKPKGTLWGLHGSFGFAMRNAFDYGYISNPHLLDKKSSTPPKMGRRFDLGTAWELPDWWIWKSRFAFDIRDMNDPNWNIKKGLHAGLEFLWRVASWFQGGWRVGMNQGYLTAGFTGDIGMFRLDFGTYARELGTSAAPLISRQYFLKASLDW